MLTVLLWAAARDAVGGPRTTAEAGELGDVIEALGRAHPALAPLLPRCRIVLDGEIVTSPGVIVADGSTVEVLPPFAGG